jgi:hypothetical protein
LTPVFSLSEWGEPVLRIPDICSFVDTGDHERVLGGLALEGKNLVKQRFSTDSEIALWLNASSMAMSFDASDIESVQDRYETKVRLALQDLDALLDEIDRLLRLMSTLKTYSEAIIAVKFYVISWCTLSDVMAKLINVVFDLGIDDRDINLMMLLRNAHVRPSGLSDLMSKHQSDLRVGYYTELRNDIIHRGILSDSDTQDLNSKRTRSRLIQILRKNEAKKEQRRFDADIKEYLRNKQSEFRKHLQATVVLLDEMIRCLSPVVLRRARFSANSRHSDTR